MRVFAMARTVSVVLYQIEAERLVVIGGDRFRSLSGGRIVLLSAERLSVQDVARRAGVSREALWLWERCYVEADAESLLRDQTRPSCTPPHSIGTP